MHILACILMFIIASVIAACEGDYSGIAVIGKVVGFLVLLFCILWLFTKPALLVVVIVILIIVVICCSKK